MSRESKPNVNNLEHSLAGLVRLWPVSQIGEWRKLLPCHLQQGWTHSPLFGPHRVRSRYLRPRRYGGVLASWQMLPSRPRLWRILVHVAEPPEDTGSRHRLLLRRSRPLRLNPVKLRIGSGGGADLLRPLIRRLQRATHSLLCFASNAPILRWQASCCLSKSCL
jgi:hypothetical protein